MDRRNFFKGSLFGAASLALASTPILSSCCGNGGKKGKKNDVELKISFQESTAPGENLEQRLDWMEEHGIVGFEPGGRGLAGRVEEIKKALSGRNIKVSAICAGFDGFILAEDYQKDVFDATMRDIVAAAGELGSTGVIMVPAFNGQTPCRPHTAETREFLVAQMHELGEYALKCGTTVILEPLNRREAHYLRLVSDAAAICRDAASEGVKCMGDFWHMQEDPSDYAAFISAGKYLQHVHVASKGNRRMPGESGDKDKYVDGFRALKEIGYDKYVSFECGTDGERNVTVPAAVELLRAQWAIA